MSKVRIENVVKRFDQYEAVKQFSLGIDDSEFIVLVGPSGCGKTTLLRMVAGLETVTQGEIYIDDIRVTHMPPKKRDIAMVFQNYALYPHMTVYNNLAFALKLRKLPKSEIAEKVNQAAEMLGLSTLLKRMPNQLSGGQKQRVALGRAIVRNPKVFLFDEPLSNLDAKLRVSMRSEILDIHRRLKNTSIYVTHDQMEAMTMGTRIVVMKDGTMQQQGTPQQIYNAPVNRFVGGFIGSPAMNLIPGEIQRQAEAIYVTGSSYRLALSDRQRSQLQDYRNHQVYLGIRPESFYLIKHTDSSSEAISLQTTVRLVEPLGAEQLVHFRIGETEMVARLEPKISLAYGDAITLGVKTDETHLFDGESGENIMIG